MVFNPFNKKIEEENISLRKKEVVDKTKEEREMHKTLSGALNKKVEHNNGFGISLNQDFTEIFDDDEELEALKAGKDNNTLQNTFDVEDKILPIIEQNIKDLRAKYPRGGSKAFRFITSDVLMEAPEDYFDKFDDVVKDGVSWVQATVSDRGKSSIIGKAQRHPTDDLMQDEAFRLVQSIAAEYMERTPFRSTEKNIVVSLICNEIVGFGKIDPLWRDREIDEIICNGPKDIQIEIRGQLYRVKSCKFRDTAHLKALIERLYGAINKTVTRTTPLVKGRLHDNSRMFVADTSVAPEGPNFNIRRHPEKFWTPKDIIENGAASKELLTFIGNLVNKGCSFLIMGGMSTGKTSMMNALSGFYPDNVRIMTFEDNLELKLNPRKFLAAAEECVSPQPGDPDSGINMRDLIKGATQQRPDVIVVGEVTDAAAYDLCQALNLGKFGASTVHANSEKDGINRLVSLVSQGELLVGDAALPLIASAFDFFIYLEHSLIDGSRRITSVSEVSPHVIIDENGHAHLDVQPLWKFVDDGVVDGRVTGHWEKIRDLSKARSERRRLDREKPLTWEQLLEISEIPEEYILKSKQKHEESEMD